MIPRLLSRLAPRPATLRLAAHYSSTGANTYHPKVSVVPFKNDPEDIFKKMQLLVPPLYGMWPALTGYAELFLGKDVVDSKIQNARFQAVYIPTWVIDSAATVHGWVGETEQNMYVSGIGSNLPGLHHYPLSKLGLRFHEDTQASEPFRSSHLNQLGDKYDILPLPFTTTPLAIPNVLSSLSVGDLSISDDWKIDPRSVSFKILAAYPVLQPAFLGEFVYEGQHTTILGHGHHDYFSVYGAPVEGRDWVNSHPFANVDFISAQAPRQRSLVNGITRTFQKQELANFLDEQVTRSSVEKLAAGPVDMDDLRVQSLKSAIPTRQWMQLGLEAEDIRSLIANIPRGIQNARIISVGVGRRPTAAKLDARNSGDADVTAPLKRQLQKLEAEIEATKPEWLREWEAQQAPVGGDGSA